MACGPCARPEERLSMAVKVSFARRLIKTLSAVRTGIILLIILGVVAAAGTVIVQSPPASAAELQRAYSPEVLNWLSRMGLTDVYHTWWFVTLLGLTALCMVMASLERFPNVWRYFSRPYRRPDPHFRAVLPTQKQIPIRDAGQGLEAAERGFRKLGLKPQRIVEHDEVSLYAERARSSTLAAYIVHAALLLVLVGYIGKMKGYHGYVALVPGQTTDRIELQNGGTLQLPFALRCDGTGQENYPDGTPKRWWSKLAVVEKGREIQRKEIEVNDPLIYGGVRFYQSGYGSSGELQRLRLAVVNPADGKPMTVLSLSMNDKAALPDGSSLQLVRFIPDAYPMEGDIYQRSRNLDNAAAQVEITKQGKTESMWLFLSDQGGQGVTLVGPYDARQQAITTSAYQFVGEVEVAPYTGLQVSHEPFQWAIWAGIVVLGIGLIMAFYLVHMRFWALPVRDERGGLVLWVGGAANKNREAFAERFARLTQAIESEAKQPQARVAVAAGG